MVTFEKCPQHISYIKRKKLGISFAVLTGLGISLGLLVNPETTLEIVGDIIAIGIIAMFLAFVVYMFYTVGSGLMKCFKNLFNISTTNN